MTLEEMERLSGIGAPPAPAPAPAPLNPAQSRLVPPQPTARGPVTSTPVPTPQPQPPGGGGGLLSKAGRMPGSLSGYDRYERGPGGVGWVDIQTGRPVTDKKLLAVLNGQDPSTVGGSGGVAAAGSIPKLYTEPDVHGRTMRAYEEYTLPSGVTVIPEPKVNKYGITYELKVVDRPKPGPFKPGDTRKRDVGGGKIIEEVVDEHGIWRPAPAHAQPPRGVYKPNEEVWANGKLWRADADGILKAAPAHMQPPPGKFEPNEEVIRGGKLWIANKDGMLEPAPPHMQPSVQSGVRPGGPPIDPEVARAEEKEYRTARAKADAEYMAKRREEREAADQRRIAVDYLGGLLEEGTARTGPLAKWWLPAAQALEGFGLLGKDTANTVNHTRVFQAISTQLQQQMRIAGTGAVSDKDMVLFGRMIPSLDDDPEANRKMIAAMKQMDNYARRVWEAREVYYDENKNLQGWEKHRKSQPDLVSPFRRVKTGSKEWDALEEGELYVDTDNRGREQFVFKRRLPQ